MKDARDQGCSWNQIGEALGVTRQAAQQRHGGGLLGRLVEGLRAGKFHRFTPRARAAVIAAQTVARGRGHDVIGTEHVLLGLYEDGRPQPRRGRPRTSSASTGPRSWRSSTSPTRPPTPPSAATSASAATPRPRSSGPCPPPSTSGTTTSAASTSLLGVAAVDDSLGARALAAQDVTPDTLRPVVEALLRPAAAG